MVTRIKESRIPFFVYNRRVVQGESLMKKVLTIILSMLVTLSMLSFTVSAAVPTYRYRGNGNTENVNQSRNDYWIRAEVLYSNLYVENGRMVRVEYDDIKDVVVIEYNDSNYHVTKTKTIKNPFTENACWGGFYCGTDYNFMVFGQMNPTDDVNLEVFRTVKYSKDWEELGHLSMYGEDTSIPFISGCLRMDQIGNLLLVRTAHQMMAHDGNEVKHQSNYDWIINIDDMTRYGECQIGYVSHSFNQFVKCDTDAYYTCDHGDAYPRSVIIIKFGYGENETTALDYCEPIVMFGKPGTNETNVRVGGFELSDDTVLTAMSSIRMENEELYYKDEQKNIYLAVAPKEDLQSFELIQFTDYPVWIDDGRVTSRAREVKTPALVKLDSNRFLLMWEEASYTPETGEVQFIAAVMIDGHGQKLSRQIKIKGYLSDCQPVVNDGKVIWYVVDENYNLYYYCLDCSSSKTLERYDQSSSIDGEISIDYSYKRIYGNNRYETALEAAAYLKKVQGVEKFDTVVVTTGQAFPDALSGSYLANQHNAPIILVRADKAHEVREFIRQNVNSGGNVFILGGENAVPDEWLSSLSGFNIERISGNNRYGTNINVLKKLGYSGGDILVCVGTNFADSLSCAAVDMPMMLVGASLNDAQKEFLSSCTDVRFHIVGGTGAVSSAVEKQLSEYGKVKERIAGSNRYDTSAAIARRFFNDPDKIVIAYGKNYPDGLSGGSLAYALKAPLILAESNNTAAGYGAKVAYEFSCSDFVVLGGPSLVSGDIVRWMIKKSVTG